jgi:hypothetical protein
MAQDVGLLERFRKAFNSVGWFIPPYTTLGYLQGMTTAIQRKGAAVSQQDLESLLAMMNTRDHLAAMVAERYAVIPHVREYRSAIAEGVEAHFHGLNRAAVNVLLPIIEGVGTRIAASRGMKFGRPGNSFAKLAENRRQHVVEKRLGAVGEIISMLESFAEFAEKYLYINSTSYALNDGTNRPGILHGAYADADYGRPINFYKALGAIDFLCFVSTMFTGSGSIFSPGATERSMPWAAYLSTCEQFASIRPNLADEAAAAA